MNVYLNGKFTAQRTTGVQRVAACLLQALDEQFVSAQPNWTLLCPAAGVAPALRRIAVRHIGRPGLGLHRWEQCVLPRAARGGLLVNLAGAAPYFAGRQLCLLHDAAVFDRPVAYTPAFVAWYRLLFRRLARRASQLVTVSDFSRSRLALHLRLSPAALAVIHNGGDHLNAVAPDLRVLDDLRLVGTRFLLAVGSDSANKNLAALVEAYTSLPADRTRRLVIAGGRNDGVFARAGLPETADVVRIGPLSDARLKALYQHAIAFVFPSLYEGFGLPPLEAMACGCPVAAAAIAPIRETCGDAALYFDPRSPADIASALRQLLGDAPLRERLRAAGHVRAADFRWHDAGARLHERIDAVCTLAESGT